MIADNTLATIRSNRALLVQALRTAGAQANGQSALRCPFHEDGSASGSIHHGEDGGWRFTCHACTWNGTARTGDAVDVLRKARPGLGFTEAVAELGGSAESSTRPSQKTKADLMPDLATEHAAAVARLQADQALLTHLRRTRGLSAETAERFGVGVTVDGRHWIFSVRDGDTRAALKLHRTRNDVTPKCVWKPRGTKSAKLFPVHLVGSGPVFLCPGELKALAVIETGHSAVGITSGETVDLPAELLDLCEGRTVAVVPDDDATGRKWLDEIVRPFFAGSSAQLVTPALGLDAKNGLKDIGDLVTKLLTEDECSAEKVGQILVDACDRADPWRAAQIGRLWSDPETWQPVEHIRTGLRDLDAALGGGLRIPSTTLLAAPPGRGKTQLAVQVCGNIARAGVPVGIISLELSAHDVSRLVMAQVARVPRRWLDMGELGDDASWKVRAARQHCQEMPLTVLDGESLGVVDRERLGAVISRGARELGWRVVLLDYLGLLASPDSDRSEYHADILNSTAIKVTAQRHRVAILAVASLRKSKAKDGPGLDDISGAGRLGYDATNAFILTAEGPVREGNDLIGLMKLVPHKRRFAESTIGEVQLRWYPRYGIIQDLERDP